MVAWRGFVSVSPSPSHPPTCLPILHCVKTQHSTLAIQAMTSLLNSFSIANTLVPLVSGLYVHVKLCTINLLGFH